MYAIGLTLPYHHQLELFDICMGFFPALSFALSLWFFFFFSRNTAVSLIFMATANNMARV